MNTQVLTLGTGHDDEAIAQAAEVIRRGGLVAFPTETVYGLGANALDASAAAKIFAAKQRALNDPLIVHVASADVGHLGDVRHLEGVFNPLTQAFWPGPLTLVLPKREVIPAIVTAGGDKVAIRMPSHPVALALIRQAGVPIAAPSANLFGHVSPTTAQHVLADLDGRIDLVLDGGPTDIGVESTVLDVTVDPPMILRPGGVTREQIEQVLGYKAGDGRRTTDDGHLSSPGLLEKHYAPAAQLMIVKDADALGVNHAVLRAMGKQVGLLLLDNQRALGQNLGGPQFVLGHSLEDVARNVYAGLRALDEAQVDVILIAQVPATGLGEAIADRLRRASSR